MISRPTISPGLASTVFILFDFPFFEPLEVMTCRKDEWERSPAAGLRSPPS